MGEWGVTDKSMPECKKGPIVLGPFKTFYRQCGSPHRSDQASISINPDFSFGGCKAQFQLLLSISILQNKCNVASQNNNVIVLLVQNDDTSLKQGTE